MTVAIIVWLFALLPVPMLQNKPPHPDLSGTWVLVPSKSSFGRDQKDTTDYTVTIMQYEPEIQITVRYRLGGTDEVRQWSYYTDGRPVSTPVKDLEIMTRWRGRKLYTSSRLKRPLDQLDEDEWELSNDGTSLTRTTFQSFISGVGPSVQQPSKHQYVFVRSK